ncbi:MAG TPA: hypothetical protein VFG03_18925 [Telluria sp.]|nr:hypothetical protein [Telluria sp.]
MSGHRHAALALQPLAARDRRLILGELPMPDQRILRRYLAELDELGFDGGTLPPAGTAPHADADAGDAHRRMLRSADSARMLAVLGHEPATLIAQFLQIEAWPWTADFLDLLAAPRLGLVRNALQLAPTRAPTRIDHLLAAVHTALAAQGSTVAADASLSRPAWYQKAIAWVR